MAAPLHSPLKTNNNYSFAELKVSDQSDGTSHGPPSTLYRAVHPRNALLKLGNALARDRGIWRPNVNFYLDRLPQGYSIHEIKSKSGEQTFKRFFGHPSGKYFDSVVRFTPHFLWLQRGMKDKECTCMNCGHVRPKPLIPRKEVKMLQPATKTSTAPRPQIGLEARRTLNRDLDRMRLADDDHARRGSAASSDQDNSSTNEGGRTGRVKRGANLVNKLVDEEGTTDIWRVSTEDFAKQQHSTRPVYDDIKEEDSVDWVCERDLLELHLVKLEQQHSFVPRIGELVLWIPEFQEDHYLMRQPKTNVYRYYSYKTRTFGDFPKWRAGVVSRTPAAIIKNGHIDMDDILSTPRKKTSLTTSGFRVETMPDPNDDLNKSWSKQYKYIPLRSMRPLAHWQLVLKGIPQRELHPSIVYAMTCMTSISLTSKWRFTSEWPHGIIMAKSVYLGSEMVTVGDVVRLMPETGHKCTDVMVIDEVVYHVHDMETPLRLQDSARIGTKSFLTISGPVYTVDITKAYIDPSYGQHNPNATIVIPRALTLEEVATIFRPVGTSEYGSWYPVHSPGERLEVSHEHVLGRLYEADAVRLWLGQRQTKPTSFEQIKPSLSFDIPSILAARRYASVTDQRLGHPPLENPDEIQWLISDSRAEALSIATFNGHEIYPYHEIRDASTMRAWRTHLKIAEGKPVNPADSDALPSNRHGRRAMIIYDDEGNPVQTKGYYIPDTINATFDKDGLKKRGRKAGSKLIGGKIYQADELLVRPELLEQLRQEQEQNKQAPPGTPSSRRAQASSQMASAALDSSSDSEEVTDDEDEEQELQMIEETEDNNIEQDLGNAYGFADVSDDEAASMSSQRSLKQSPMVARSIASPEDSVGSVRVAGPSAMPSKTQLAQSVEDGNNVEMADDDGDVSSDEQEEIDWEEWKHPRNARGGTVESSGGDYHFSQ